MASGSVDLIIQGGVLVASGGRLAASLAINEGVIVAIGDSAFLPRGRETINASGLHVLPGAIDAHVHFRDPGNTQDEDWETGSAAAACGGVTTVFDMPSTNPPVDNLENLERKHALARARSHIDYGLYGLLGAHNLPELEALASADIIGFKCFMSSSLSGRLPAPDDGVMLEGFEKIARSGRRCVVHAENLAIITRQEKLLREAGRTDGRAHARSRPPVAAAEAVSRAIVFAEAVGMRLHIAHESSADALPYIAEARRRGVDLTVETCPQYLLLTDEDVARQGGVLRCNPPIREAGHDVALWKAISDGVIDILTTDHAPHAIGRKTNANIWDNNCGLLGVETMLPLMLTEVNAGRLTLEQLVALVAANPARVWDLYPRKGTLEVGADADIVLVDLERSATIDQNALHSKQKISGWHGRVVKGLPVRTIVRGRTVALNGKLVGKPGWGKPVRQFNRSVAADP